MDGDLKKLRVRFSGVGNNRQKGASQASLIPTQELGSAQMNSSGEYDAAFAATIAATAYAIAAREEKLAIQKKPVPAAVPDESMKKPTAGSKISRWFSGKEPSEDDDEGPVNVSVRRPLKQAQRKPEDTTSDRKGTPKMLDSSMSAKKASSSSNKSPDKKGNKKFEQEQAIQRAPSTVRPATSYHSRRNGDNTAGVAAIGSAGPKADAWETARLQKIREEYQKMIQTIAEWEDEKKVKAKSQKERKEGELNKKRTKVLEEYNQEMTRINKIAGGARSMAEERRYNDEKKVKEKAYKIRSTGKVPRSCACF